MEALRAFLSEKLAQVRNHLSKLYEALRSRLSGS